MIDHQKIYFKEDAFSIISEIIKNNQLEESDHNFLERLSKNKPTQGEIILNTAGKIVLENMSKQDACSFLATELNIPAPTAELVYSEIIKKLVPLAIKETDQESKPIEKLQLPKILRHTRKIEPDQKIEMPILPKQKSGPDAYREPIE